MSGDRTEPRVDLTDIRWGSVEWTMVVTLYLRAYESRSPHSILSDQAAAEAVDRIEYDFDRIRKRVLPGLNQYLVALRAYRLDRWASEFLASHDDAVVLHLGCGLDSRAFRMSLPSGVDWYDVDVPEVIAFRRRLFSDTEHYRMLGSSVTELGWLDAIPVGRPVLVIAEGLLMYLTEPQVRDLLDRLTERFDREGALMFDGMARWVVPLHPLVRWGIGDGRRPERWNSRLRFETDSLYVKDFRRIPDAAKRRLFGLIGAIPGVGTMTRTYRYSIRPRPDASRPG